VSKNFDSDQIKTWWFPEGKVINDVTNIRSEDSTRRRGKLEWRIKEFQNGFRVSWIVDIWMRLEGTAEVEGKLFGLLFVRSGPRAVTPPQEEKELNGYRGAA
jgi:hypothetical protein